MDLSVVKVNENLNVEQRINKKTIFFIFEEI